MTSKELEIKAYESRRLILDGVHAAKCGHPGGSLSCVDALTVLYFDEMNVDPTDPKNPDRDRFVLSKGHCAPALYATLANRGYFPKEDMLLLRSIKAHLSGPPIWCTFRALSSPPARSVRESPAPSEWLSPQSTPAKPSATTPF